MKHYNIQNYIRYKNDLEITIAKLAKEINCSTRTIHRNMCAELKREKELLNQQLKNETL